ncbi:MAG: CofH family radical SAM protein [Planctomycetota bacterium]
MDPNVILKAAIERQEVSAIEALMLMQQEDPIFADIFQVANEVNRRTNQGIVSFTHRTHVFYTNVSRASSKHCSYFRKKGDKEAFTLTADDVVAKIASSPAKGDVAIQGALNPDLSIEYLVRLVSTVREEYPHIHIHAFSPTEIFFASRRARVPAREILAQLKEAGLDSMPGTGADILNDKVRKKISPDRIRTADWVDVVKTAHHMGIKTTATIVVGHVENEIHICEHIEILRNIQKETGGFVEFQIIPHVPEPAPGAEVRPRMSQQHLMKLVAVCRVFFGQIIPNIQSPWALFGMPEAVQTLSVGANDLGGTHFQQGAYYQASSGPKYTAPEILEKAILKAQRRPKLRDSVYQDGSRKAQKTRRLAMAAR